MEILTSGGERRHIKSFNLYASTDNQNWEKVYSDTEVTSQDLIRFYLDPNKRIKARYLKLEITDGYGTDGDFVRINEIQVAGISVSTGISSPTTHTNEMKVYCMGDELSVSFQKDLSQLQLHLYTVDGTSVFSSNLQNLTQGTQIYVPMQNKPNGVYLLSAESGDQKWIKPILWKH